MKRNRIAVLGAGLSGLSIGLKLSQHGHDVVIIEERDTVGGQALSINHNGATFDLGPHAWHTLSNHLNSFYSDICGTNNLHSMHKKARIYFNGTYFDYPLKIKTVAHSLPIGTAFLAFLKYITRPKPEIISAEDFFVSTYGEKVYELFFKKYTQRVWGISPSLIDRKFFYKRVPALNLFQLFLRTLFGSFFIKKAQTDDAPGYAYDIKMVYPKSGCGLFANNLSRKIKELGGQIYLNSSVTGIIHDSNTIKSILISHGEGSSYVGSSYCISTIPITSFIKSLKPKIIQLDQLANSLFYRAIIIVCLIINKENISDYQTIYFYENIFTRIGFMNNFSFDTCPSGKTAITAELTCFENDDTWNMNPDELKDLVVSELVDLGFFHQTDVESYTIIKEKYGYPVLKVGDVEKLEIIFDSLNTISNLSVIGRQGRFDYIQMADAVRDGLSCSERVMEYFDNLESPK